MAITLPGGFNITNNEPADARVSVANQTARLALSSANVYEGLKVYERDTNLTYTLIDATTPSASLSWEIDGSSVFTKLSGSNTFIGNQTISGSLVVSGSLTGDGSGLTNIQANSVVGLNLSQISSGSYSASISQNGGLSVNTSITASGYSGDGSGLINIPASSVTGLNLSQISSGSYSASVSENGGLSVNTTVSATSFTGSGDGLINIPASSIIGLNLSQIASGSVSASISETNGLVVNTSVTASGFSGSGVGLTDITPTQVGAEPAIPNKSTGIVKYDTGWVFLSGSWVTEDLLSLSNNSTANVTTARHGLTPKLPNIAGQYLDGQGNWTTPSGVVNSYKQQAFSNVTSSTVIHNFNTYPEVKCYDTNNEEFIPYKIKNNTVNDFTVTFSTSSSGTIVATVGSPQPQQYTTVNSNYTVAVTDRIISCTTAGITVNLITAVGNAGREFVIDNASTGTIYVDASGSESINNTSIQSINKDNAMHIYSNGVNWRIY